MVRVGCLCDYEKCGRIAIRRRSSTVAISRAACSSSGRDPSIGFATHQFHNTMLHHGEVKLIDMQLVRNTCLGWARPDELIARVCALECDGPQELL
jgi:hypothetical protein